MRKYIVHKILQRFKFFFLPDFSKIFKTECYFIGTNRRFWCSNNEAEPNSGQFSILDTAIKSSSADAVLNVMIALPLFIFRLHCYKIKTFRIGCLLLLKQEVWWILAHLPHPALSSLLEMMHDLNFTEGKQKCVDPLVLIVSVYLWHLTGLLVALTDHRVRRNSCPQNARFVSRVVLDSGYHFSKPDLVSRPLALNALSCFLLPRSPSNLVCIASDRRGRDGYF